MKIIQLLMTPNDSAWQGVLLGLGDNGVTYHCQTGTWKPYIAPVDAKSEETCARCGGLGYLPDACKDCGGSGVSLHNAGGMARELAVQDSESPTNVNG